MIRTYGEWIDIVGLGTSGDQAMDILLSWKEDAYKHLESIHKLEKENAILIDRVNKLEIWEGFINTMNKNGVLVEFDNSSNAASILGSIKSEKKSKSSAENGKKGGRPKKVTNE